jgi:exodeoxyribonuclease-3
MSPKRLMSWNVNGIRAILKKNFYDVLETHEPDILCLQEVRAEETVLNVPEYEVFWHACSVKKGYSGTAVLTKIPPIASWQGLRDSTLDDEGRTLTLEFEKFFLVNVYTPNSGDGLKRLNFRTQEWDPAFLKYLKLLEATKPVIFCGDLNVAHQPIDIARPADNERTAGFTIEERENFSRFIAAGFIDSFREFNQEPNQYSWWSYRTNARARNIGWRIDYFCLSQSLRPQLLAAAIHPEVVGSDHCPVSIVFDGWATTELHSQTSN